jgi:hypothetical protein
MPTVPARASISQILPRDYHQAENVIQLAIGQQSCIGGDAGTVELQLETASKLSRKASDSDSPVGCAMIALDPRR